MDYITVDTQTTNNANLAAAFVTVADYTPVEQQQVLATAICVGTDDSPLAALVDTKLTVDVFVGGRFVSRSAANIPAGNTHVKLQTGALVVQVGQQFVLKLRSDQVEDDEVDVIVEIYETGVTAEILSSIRTMRTFSAREG